MKHKYVGRFAPTPSGPLHFGSLVAAVASYVDARANNGDWLVRIEDIDPPRCQPNASDNILQTLEKFGLHWDREVVYQSAQTDYYFKALDKLRQQDLLYYCSCSRSQLKGNSVYLGTCRSKSSFLPESSVRIKVAGQKFGFNDLFLPAYYEDLTSSVGDFILRRKDGLVAYQLAVVVDDGDQGVTHVIRGADLYNQTPRQMFLQACLNLPCLIYGHIPLILNQQGQKLSKQNLAQPIDFNKAPALMYAALRNLNHRPPYELSMAPVAEQLDWANDHWQRSLIPKEPWQITEQQNC